MSCLHPSLSLIFFLFHVFFLHHSSHHSPSYVAVDFFLMFFIFDFFSQFFKRVKKAHTWEVPQRDSDEQRAIEEEDDEFMRKKLAETLLNATESKCD